MTGASAPSFATKPLREATATALCWLAKDGRLARLSYRELYRAASALASRFRSELSPGARVAVWAGNAPEWVVLEYATALAGAILTPINPAVTDAELLALVTQSQPTLLYAATEFRGSSPLDRARDVTSSLAIEIRPLEEALAAESASRRTPAA